MMPTDMNYSGVVEESNNYYRQKTRSPEHIRDSAEYMNPHQKVKKKYQQLKKMPLSVEAQQYNNSLIAENQANRNSDNVFAQKHR